MLKLLTGILILAGMPLALVAEKGVQVRELSTLELDRLAAGRTPEPRSAAFYNADDKTIYLDLNRFQKTIANRCRTGREIQIAKEMLLYHERVHDWQNTVTNYERLVGKSTPDRRVALMAIIEGFAEWKTRSHYCGSELRELHDRLFTIDLLDPSLNPRSRTLEDHFIYERGCNYVEHFASHHESVGEDQLFRLLIGTCPDVIGIYRCSTESRVSENAEWHSSGIRQALEQRSIHADYETVSSLRILSIAGYPKCEALVITNYLQSCAWKLAETNGGPAEIVLITFAQATAARRFFQLTKQFSARKQSVVHAYQMERNTVKDNESIFLEEWRQPKRQGSCYIATCYKDKSVLYVADLKRWNLVENECLEMLP